MLTLSPPAPKADLTVPARSYRQLGWTVVESLGGVSLMTDRQVGAIELVGELARGVHEYLRINGLLGPVIEVPGQEYREIHLVSGLAKADMAINWLTEVGATVHRDGATVALPPTESHAGPARWSSIPERSLPAAVAIAAAVRAVRARAIANTGRIDRSRPAAS
jgi:hypothetical protein